jgi:hypothetical protein
MPPSVAASTSSGSRTIPTSAASLDTFALIGDLLARTERLRFFPDVANLPPIEDVTEQIERVAEEVAPGVREAVAARSTPG